MTQTNLQTLFTHKCDIKLIINRNNLFLVELEH
jgi:hypothetical protein